MVWNTQCGYKSIEHQNLVNGTFHVIDLWMGIWLSYWLQELELSYWWYSYILMHCYNSKGGEFAHIIKALFEHILTRYFWIPMFIHSCQGSDELEPQCFLIQDVMGALGVVY
jgi:hypothetical protein